VQLAITPNNNCLSHACRGMEHPPTLLDLLVTTSTVLRHRLMQAMPLEWRHHFASWFQSKDLSTPAALTQPLTKRLEGLAQHLRGTPAYGHFFPSK
jgi:hypothetical protein